MGAQIRWIAAGFLFTLSAGFGQTYFIAIFAGYLKTGLAISDGQFGGLYTVATISSAACLVWAGQIADKVAIRWLGVGLLTGLALSSLAMAGATCAWLLLAAFFGLRFFGQGMLNHVAMTAMGRWFSVKRGRAASIAGLGMPVGEAIWPFIAISLVALVGWRWTWIIAALVLVAVAIPVLLLLLHDEPPMLTPVAPAPLSTPQPSRRDWTRRQVLRSPLFYALLPGVLAPALVLTGIFFNQVNIVQLKGWELSWFAAGFAVLAGVSIFSALASGWFSDRFGARRLLPVFLLPLAAGMLLLTYAQTPSALLVFMGLTGLTLGTSSTMQGALWPELYGIAHLGAIRSLVTAGMVSATAFSPGLIGVLLDVGVGLHRQLLAMTFYCFAAVVWMTVLLPRLNRQVGGG